LEQVRHLRHDIWKLQDLWPQGLLPRKSEELPGQPRGTIGVRLDLLNIVIVAVAGRMAHQHQVTVTDDRRQNVVEVVRDAARELSDHLHLSRLRDLPLELGFLTIVLEQEQDRRVAEAAEARYSQRDRLPALVSQPYRKVAGHRRPTRVT